MMTRRHSRPCRLVQAGIRQVLGHDGEVRRGTGQNGRLPPAGTVELGDGVGQLAVGVRIVEGPSIEAQARAQLAPGPLLEAGGGCAPSMEARTWPSKSQAQSRRAEPVSEKYWWRRPRLARSIAEGSASARKVARDALKMT